VAAFDMIVFNITRGKIDLNCTYVPQFAAKINRKKQWRINNDKAWMPICLDFIGGAMLGYYLISKYYGHNNKQEILETLHVENNIIK
jgi:hypothetical protein